jgi:hypothetical protein
MTPAGWAALAIAVFGAFSYGAGSVLQAVGARRSSSTVSTLGHPLYLIGVGCDLLAWAGSMIALRELAVYFVQSVLAGSLAVTVVAARFLLGSRLRGRDVAAVVVTIAALTVLAMSAGPQEQVAASGGLRLGFCAAALATALIGWGATKAGSPGVVAALGGLCLGGAALCGRALSLPAQPMDHLGAAALAIVTEPLTAALVVFAATGMLLYTNALQHGQVGPVTAVLWIAEVIAPSAVALVLLGDTVRPGWELRAAVAGAITVGAAVLLATAPVTSTTAELPDGRPSEPQRTAIPVGGRWPLALPSRDSQFGTILWWGSPTSPLPIWRPPDRAKTARAPQPASPYSAQPSPYSAQPSPYPAQPIWADPQPLDAPAAGVPQPAIAGARHRPALPAAPSSDPQSAATIWSGPPAGPQPAVPSADGGSVAIWRPPNRTHTARAPQSAAEPGSDRPYRTQSPWADPPSG